MASSVGGDDMIVAGSLRELVFGDAATLSGFAGGGGDVIVAGNGSYHLIWGDGSKLLASQPVDFRKGVHGLSQQPYQRTHAMVLGQSRHPVVKRCRIGSPGSACRAPPGQRLRLRLIRT